MSALILEAREVFARKRVRSWSRATGQRFPVIFRGGGNRVAISSGVSEKDGP